MGQSEIKPRLIHTKRGVVFTLCCIGYMGTLSVRDLFRHSQHNHHWLLDLDWLAYWHISLPAWVTPGVNLAFYAGLLRGAVLLYRLARGQERVLVVSWATVIFLGLIEFLVSSFAASAIGFLKAVMGAVAFLAATAIFLQMPANGYPRAGPRIHS